MNIGIGNQNSDKHRIIPTQHNDCMTTQTEDFEIFISGFMLLSSDDDLKTLCYTILHFIAPSLNINEIESVRLLRIRSTHDVSEHISETKNVNVMSVFPPIIVRLTTSSRVKQIISLKRDLNYLNIRDLDFTILTEVFATRLK